MNLALGFPVVSYQWAIGVIQNVIADRLSDQMAITLLAKNCPPSQFDDNLDLLNAFLSYNTTRQFDGLRVFDEFAGRFQAGPDVSVPVRPTVLLREGGVLKPLFIVGWATNTLKYYQRRLLTSIYEDAIFSLTDLRDSPGEVLLFPKNGYGQRTVERWSRDSYEPLSRAELIEQVERYVAARAEARPQITERFAMRAARQAEQRTERRQAQERGHRTDWGK